MFRLRVFAPSLFGIVALIAAGTALHTSFIRAREQADALIAKVRTPHTFQSDGAHLCLVRGISGLRGPCWEFNYEPDDFGVSDLTLDISLSGEVLASNPPAALSKLWSMP